MSGVEDDDDDDDLAALFSFGSEDADPSAKAASAASGGGGEAAVAVSGGAGGGGGAVPGSPATALSASTTTAGPPSSSTAGGGAAEESVAGSLLEKLSSGGTTPNSRSRAGSDDSFVEFLEEHGGTSDSKGGGISLYSAPLSPASKQQREIERARSLDDETKDMLRWLDDNDSGRKDSNPLKKMSAAAGNLLKRGSLNRNRSASSKDGGEGPPEAPAPEHPTVVKLPPLFNSLAEALESDESTVEQVRRLAKKEQQQQQASSTSTSPAAAESADAPDSPSQPPPPQPPQQQLTPSHRAELYARMLTNGKQRWSDICDGSLAEAFKEHCASNDNNIESRKQEEDSGGGGDAARHGDLAAQIASYTKRDVHFCQEDLNKLLSYHRSQQQQQQQKKKSASGDVAAAADQPAGETATAAAAEPGDETKKGEGAESNGGSGGAPAQDGKGGDIAAAAAAETTTKAVGEVEDEEVDPMLPPAMAALLAALTHPSLDRDPPTLLAATSVLWQRLLGSRMPLLALPPDERWEATCTMHLDFYLLATYHLPLLVLHLDRYLPGWYWPKCVNGGGGGGGGTDQQSKGQDLRSITQKSRKLQQQGKMAPSWLVTAAAGECYLTSVLYLWDKLFIDTNNSMSFFLLLALLEPQADSLLLLTGDALQTALEQVLVQPDHQTPKEPLSGASNDSDGSGGDDSLRAWVNDWWKRAQALQAQTPESVEKMLQNAEDKAVQEVLRQRQERAQAALQARLEAEREAHRLAQEAKAQAARDRLTRARLVVYYRKHAPDKEGNIDKIMVTYAGRFEELDAKLKLKYGESFNPALKPQAMSQNANKILSTMNTGLGSKRRSVSGQQVVVQEEESESEESATSEQVSVLVNAAEVLPVICWTREAASARGQQRRRRLTDQPQLKFYLVDSRSEEAADEQGRFPTAIHLSPEALMDPDRLDKMEERFESLRGTAHIVVMGEGFAALPDLYGHKLNPRLEQCMHNDEAQTNICALFFVKKGFPFVSVLNGGFCAAHSWLVRHGPSQHLTASQVLVDYDPDASLFGQLESIHNASSATEKAQRKMQLMMDKSMAAVTRRAIQLEKFADELDNRDGRQTLRAAEKGFKSAFAGFRGSITSMDPVELNEASAPAAAAGEKGKGTDGDASSKASSDAEKKETTGTTAAAASAALDEASAAQPQLERFTSASGMFKGLGTAWKQTSTPVGSSPSSFAGAGAEAAPDNSKQAQQQPQAMGGMLKRNPFARFGGGGANATSAPAGGGAGGGGAAGTGFGGLNQFRRAALARMRSGGNAPTAAPSGSGGGTGGEGGDVSISFASSSASSGGGGSAAGSEAANPAAPSPAPAPTVVAVPPPPPPPPASPKRKESAEVERV